MATTNIEWVEKNGTAARGKREYLAFLRGQHLTMKQRVLANCYQCTGMYTDGREDCEVFAVPRYRKAAQRRGIQKICDRRRSGKSRRLTG